MTPFHDTPLSYTFLKLNRFFCSCYSSAQTVPWSPSPVLMITFKALSNLAPLPLQTLLLGLPTSLIPLQPHWLLCVLHTCQAHTRLRDTARAILFAWNALPPESHRLVPHLLPVSIQMSPSQQCLSWLACLKFHIHPHFLFAFPALFFLLSIYNYLTYFLIFIGIFFIICSLLHPYYLEQFQP